jgi:hypothetical protein
MRSLHTLQQLKSSVGYENQFKTNTDLNISSILNQPRQMTLASEPYHKHHGTGTT